LIAVHAEECADGECIVVETIAPINEAEADEHVALDLVHLGARAEIIVRGDRAAPAKREVRTFTDGGVVLRDLGNEIHRHSIDVHPQVGEHLGPLRIRATLIRIVLDLTVVARLRIASVAHEPGQASEGFAEDVATVHDLAAERGVLPGVRIRRREIVVMVVDIRCRLARRILAAVPP
jgi:hypothetical protein